VSGVVAAIDKNYGEEIFNLGCGKTEELMDYIRVVEESTGKKAELEFLPMQKGDALKSAADITKAKKMLGYEPKTTIDVGVPKFVQWYKDYYGA
jgi:UDP-glucuronate 4-epimerase